MRPEVRYGLIGGAIYTVSVISLYATRTDHLGMWQAGRLLGIFGVMLCIVIASYIRSRIEDSAKFAVIVKSALGVAVVGGFFSAIVLALYSGVFDPAVAADMERVLEPQVNDETRARVSYLVPQPVPGVLLVRTLQNFLVSGVVGGLLSVLGIRLMRQQQR